MGHSAYSNNLVNYGGHRNYDGCRPTFYPKASTYKYYNDRLSGAVIPEVKSNPET